MSIFQRDALRAYSRCHGCVFGGRASLFFDEFRQVDFFNEISDRRCALWIEKTAVDWRENLLHEWIISEWASRLEPMRQSQFASSDFLVFLNPNSSPGTSRGAAPAADR